MCIRDRRYYVTGGEVWTNAKNNVATHADYIKSLGIFMRLRKTNAADLTAPGADADVYLRMMVAASLDVSGRARLWTGDPGFVSDPLVRYYTIKTFRSDERYRFKKDLFDALPVESMRLVFENQITDAELPWLATVSYTHLVWAWTSRRPCACSTDPCRRRTPMHHRAVEPAWPCTTSPSASSVSTFPNRVQAWSRLRGRAPRFPFTSILRVVCMTKGRIGADRTDGASRRVSLTV